MNPVWTPEQSEAIAARGGNLLLSAAAGSGKTAVLVARVRALMAEGVPLDRMLIVTFTRAAASEMKARILREARDDPKALEGAERATICTLHAFCADLIRTYFEVAQIDPAFRVLDDAEAGQLSAAALEQALEEAYARADDEGLAALNAGRGVKGVGALTTALYEFAQTRPDPDAWLRAALLGDPASAFEAASGVLLEAARTRLADAYAVLDFALGLCGEIWLAPYRDTLRLDMNDVAGLFDLPYGALSAALNAYKPGKLNTVRLSAKLPDDEYAEKDAARGLVKSLREDFKGRMEKLREFLPNAAYARDDLAASAPAKAALYELVTIFGAAYARGKAERAAYTFSDLEHAALRALRDPGVAAACRARYECVFVDEYQDTSDLQEAVLARVTRGDNLFMVGDVKQSIYRFRGAAPSLFIEKYGRYGAGDGGRVIALTRNFRSRAAILDFVNAVFERAMSGDSEIRYDAAARLVPGAAYQGDDPPVSIDILTDETEDDSERVGAAREGALAAAYIREVVGAPFDDPKTGETRPLRPRDVAVIARTRAAIAAIWPALRDAGIPAYADASEGYLGALEVRVMLALMTTIGNRRLDQPLIETLRSPIGGFSSTALAQMRAHCPEGSFREACLAWMERPEGAELRAFEDKLDRWRTLERAMPLADWIDLLLRETGYYAYACAMPGGAARRGNLDLLCQYAGAFEETREGGAEAFLDYVRAIDRRGGDMGAAHALGEGDDVVRIMTVHKSKGLEFPVVIGVQLGRSLEREAERGELVAHARLGAGLWHVDTALSTRRETITRRAVRALLARESLEEEKRVLYVLLTRARHRLILIGTQKNRAQAQARFEIAERARISPTCCLDMLMPAADCASIAWRETTAGADAAACDAPNAPESAGAADFRDAYAWVYPYAAEAFTPVRMSVTSMTRTLTGARVIPPIARRPRFMEQESTSAVARGVSIHAAMAALDYPALRGLDGDALRDALSAQLDDLYARGVLDSPAPIGLIEAFLRGDLGARLRAASRIEREWPFLLKMAAREALGEGAGDLVVQGVIDCCFIEDGAWVLLDFKTDRDDKDDAFLARYGAQLRLYRRALAQITDFPVRETWLCLLGAKRAVAVP